jgi:hypothetical protein
MAVVRAMHPEISRVQQRAAFLLQLARSGRPDPEGLLAAEVEAIQLRIIADFTSLKEEIQKLPDKVSSHGRIGDTLKALKSVYSILEQARSQFATQLKGKRAPVIAKTSHLDLSPSRWSGP